ncbi:glycosyltransferase, partial [Patescibacteria group bacterium]|nr:glycosyltransferase [Patescibacteria group bacterium]
MVNQISVVINTFNEEGHIERVVNNVGWADEIVIVDSGSTDRTLEILRRMKIGKDKLKIFKIKSIEYVEQARNFAISKASHEWILILDADEEIIETLAKKLEEIAEKMHQIDYVRVPRK